MLSAGDYDFERAALDTGGPLGVSIGGRKLSYRFNMALQDANQIVERIRSSAAAGTFPTNVITAFPNNGTVSGFTNLTNETVTVSYANAAANPLDVRVQVQWLENGRRTVNAHVRTLVTQRA